MKTEIFKAYESMNGKFVVFGSDGLREYPADRCQNITDAKLLYLHDAIKNRTLFTKHEYEIIIHCINLGIDILVQEYGKTRDKKRSYQITEFINEHRKIKEKIEREIKNEI